MKKTISIMFAAALLLPAVPAMAQPGHDNHGQNHGGPGDHDRGGDRGPGMRGPMRGGPGGPGYGHFNRGDRFDRAHAPNYAVIDYRRHRGLRAPPRGYRWVRSGNDAVLIGITSGIVASVIANSMR